MEALVKMISLLCFSVTYVLLLRLFAMGTMELLKLFRSRGFNPLSILKGEFSQDSDVVDFKMKNLKRLTHLVWGMGLTLLIMLVRFAFGATKFKLLWE